MKIYPFFPPVFAPSFGPHPPGMGWGLNSHILFPCAQAGYIAKMNKFPQVVPEKKLKKCFNDNRLRKHLQLNRPPPPPLGLNPGPQGHKFHNFGRGLTAYHNHSRDKAETRRFLKIDLFSRFGPTPNMPPPPGGGVEGGGGHEFTTLVKGIQLIISTLAE